MNTIDNSKEAIFLEQGNSCLANYDKKGHEKKTTKKTNVEL